MSEDKKPFRLNLDREPIDLIPADEQVVIGADGNHSHPDDDIQYAKDSLKVILENGKSAANESRDQAISAGLPDGFTSYASVVSSLVGAAKALGDIADKQAKRKGIGVPTPLSSANVASAGDVNQTNILFSGSTAEMQSLIKKLIAPPDVKKDG